MSTKESSPLYAQYLTDLQKCQNMNSGFCWHNCGGKLVSLPKEQQTQHHSERTEITSAVDYIVVAKCDKCGRTASFFTYEQWLLNLKHDSLHTIREGKEELDHATDEYQTELTKIKKKLADKKAEITRKTEEAKKNLTALKELGKT